MSIYVIRYGDLLKIGYSSDLAARVYSIIHGIPGGQAKFVGHMPGDREVEAHFHAVFEASRFSGEWFRETDALLQWCEIALIKEMPKAVNERVLGTRRAQYDAAAAEAKKRLRKYAAHAWPEYTHEQRTRALAEELGWRYSRTRDFYHGDGRAVLRSTEAAQLDGLTLHSSRVAGDDR